VSGGQRTPRKVLDDLARIVRSSKTITDRGYETFMVDETQRLAGQQLISQLGEAVTHLDDTFRAEHPDVRWNEIRGMRNLVAHRYWAIDDDLVWQALLVHIPDLGRRLDLVSPQESGSGSTSPVCGRVVKSTGRPCLLKRGHRGRCRSVT